MKPHLAILLALLTLGTLHAADPTVPGIWLYAKTLKDLDSTQLVANFRDDGTITVTGSKQKVTWKPTADPKVFNTYASGGEQGKVTISKTEAVWRRGKENRYLRIRPDKPTKP